MAFFDERLDIDRTIQIPIWLTSFTIDGLFHRSSIDIKFPQPLQNAQEPSILILSGRNGVGKTTILRMVGGMLDLDFKEFRRVPFKYAILGLSTGDKLTVEWCQDKDFPIRISFRDSSVSLSMITEPSPYSPSHVADIAAFRALASPILRGINYELLDLDRSPRKKVTIPDELLLHVSNIGRPIKRLPAETPTLARRVANFLRDVQIDHNRFFRRDDSSFLPRILERLSIDARVPTSEELLNRVEHIKSGFPVMTRYGLSTNADDVNTLQKLIEARTYNSPQQVSLIETYVEMQEGAQKARDLIVNRLAEFEKIMDDFFIGKLITIERPQGLRIMADDLELTEDQLSSGEYHFLYMMVAALLCQRVGTVIAIDEPELSLHVSWQRRLVSALAKCAAGASPLFFFATHSLVIPAEHVDKVQKLSAID